MKYRAPIFSIVGMFLTLIIRAGAIKESFRDWKDLSQDLGWDSFNDVGEPFDKNKNLAYCGRRTINIKFDASAKDYSREITDALLALRSSDPPGGTVRLGPGVFPTAVPINVTSYSCLIGNSMGTTTLRLVDNANTFANSGIVRSYLTEHITIANLTIDGNMKNQGATDTSDLDGEGYGRYGLYTYLNNFLYLYRVRVVNNLGYGFDPHGSKKDWAYYLIMEECEAANNGMDGITIDQTMYVLIRNCKSISNGRHGINIVTGTRYLNAVNNVMKMNGFSEGTGCNFIAQNSHLKGTKEIIAMNNELEDARKGGLCFNDVSGIELHFNTIKNKDKRAYCYHLVKTTNLAVKNSICEAVQS